MYKHSMNEPWYQPVLTSTDAKAATKHAVIQSLWSGYGEIIRVKLIDGNAPTCIVKHIKPICFTLCSLPLAYLAMLFFTDQLGANPIERITRYSGTWALRMTLITLMATPLQRALGAVWPFRIRRMLGLFGFFYVTLHLANYIVLDQFFDGYEIYFD